MAFFVFKKIVQRLPPPLGFFRKKIILSNLGVWGMIFINLILRTMVFEYF